ncbi:MAG: site-specific integrase [Bacteroidetes bacterium]|nr:site-specific integrase [Bacteroidota bacterium]
MFLSKIGSIYYLFFKDESGVRHKVSTGSRKKPVALQFLRDFKREEYEAKKKLETVLFSEFVNQYAAYASSVHTAKTFNTYQTAFREWLRVEGDGCLNIIGIREIEHFLSVKKLEASEWTARKYYIALASAFEKAIQWQFIPVNPFRKVAKPKVREILPVFFTESDFRLFLSANNDKDFAELCITAILTGLRLGELLALRWTDIDFAAKTILIQNSEAFTTKSKRSRVVPMSEELRRLLTDRKGNIRHEAETVFHDVKGKPLKEGTASQRFKRYVRRAGLNDKLHFHSLRHSFASGLVMSGVSLYQVQKLLGHSTSKTTEIYSHLLPQQLHKEVNGLAAKFNLQHGQEN